MNHEGKHDEVIRARRNDARKITKRTVNSIWWQKNIRTKPKIHIHDIVMKAP